MAIGDFSTTRVDGEFSLVYLVFNTIFNLVTQEAQVACFENAAAHLPGGRFVIETHVPDLQRLPLGQTIIPFRADPGRDLVRRLRCRDAALQLAALPLHRGRVRATPVELRYAWPAELDLMARIAGLTLEHRSAGGSASRSRRYPEHTSPCTRRAERPVGGPARPRSTGRGALHGRV